MDEIGMTTLSIKLTPDKDGRVGEEMSIEENVGDLLALLLGEAVSLEGFYAKSANLFIINMMILHFRPLFKKY